MPDGSSIDIRLKGSAGQSFCAFLAKGVSCTLEGDANDYVGKFKTLFIFTTKNISSVFECIIFIIQCLLKTYTLFYILNYLLQQAKVFLEVLL